MSSAAPEGQRQPEGEGGKSLLRLDAALYLLTSLIDELPLAKL